MQHPHAKLALILALCGFCTASISGMIAIFVGSSALKAIKAEPGRYTGAGMAKTGVVLGLVEYSLAAFVLGRGMSNSSTGNAVVVLLVGLAAAAAPIALAAKRKRAVAQAVSFASVPVLLAGGALTGLWDAHAEASSKQERCTRNETDAATQFAAKNYSAANAAISLARSACPDTWLARQGASPNAPCSTQTSARGRSLRRQRVGPQSAASSTTSARRRGAACTVLRRRVDTPQGVR